MKKLISLLAILTLFAALFPLQSSAQSDTAHRLSGRIVLQVEEQGEAWYINPVDHKRYYLGRPLDAWNIMRALGLGATNADLNKVPTHNNNIWTISQDMIKYVNGRILIQVELNGEAWYVSPVNLRRYYMGRPADAFQLMRNLGLGITNGDLEQIEIGTTSYDDGATTGLIQPSDLVYQGAFRMPSGQGSDAESWDWGGTSMTYYPSGDAGGTNDGYTGSLFGTGHEQYQYISEVNIPRPVNSSSKNLNELNIASTLQNFQDVRGNFLGDYVEIPRVGLAYMPRQGNQDSDKIHFGWGQHFQEANDRTHGWFNLNLANPQRKGGWYIDSQSPYSTNDYLFDIPTSWASANTPGKLIATGRYRDGGWSGQGPELFAYGPWNDGNPPADGTRLNSTTLIQYVSSEVRDALFDSSAYTMNNYHHSDEWTGASWLTKGDKGAVIFAGTKGIGSEYWYGDANGPCMECAGDRGWWSPRFEGQIIFYNPQDLADVARGKKQPHEPQPYASLNIDQYLYHITGNQQKYHLGAIAFDRERGILYVFEYLGDTTNQRPLVHVWNIK